MGITLTTAADSHFLPSFQRSVLLQLYRSSREDPEVRIAAYQQLLRCPDEDLYEVVKITLKSETSSQGLIQTTLVRPDRRR